MGITKNISTLSKVNKSKEWKQRKRAMHEANRSLRSQLESQKSNAKGSDREAIQKRIDAIGAGKKA